jgi:hypothetical protein
MTDKNIDIDDFTEDDKPQSTWAKLEKPGDKVFGQLLEVSEKKSNNPEFEDQRVFVIKQANGEIVNYGVKMSKDYLIQRSNTLGNDLMKYDIKIKFELVKLIKARIKGHHDAKSIEIFVKKTAKPLDAQEEFDNM